MSIVLFLHDTSLSTPRGAELTINELILLGKHKGYSTKIDLLKDFELTKKYMHEASLIVVNSTSRCDYEKPLIQYLLRQNTPYIKVEYDYNFCIRRNILCTVDAAIKSCCDPDKFHLFRRLFAKSKLTVFQSPKHYKAHYNFYGEALGEPLIMPPTVNVEYLKVSATKTEGVIPFFGDLNYLKGGDAYVNYAKAHPELQFQVYGNNRLRGSLPLNISFYEPIENAKVLEILGRTKQFICKPVWPEPSGRLAAEAFLSDCELITNDRVGTFSFDFYPNDKDKAITEMKQAPEAFWLAISRIIDETNGSQKVSKLGAILVYKSYGGLGDIFFAIPAIYKLSRVSQSLHFAVAPRLVAFFKSHLKGVTVVNEDLVKDQESKYNAIYELGNYPAFRGYDLPHALKYPTHKKVKQHAIQHYIDTVSKLHIEIDNQFKTYPYFKRQLDATNTYYVVHPGAGFLLKIWPTDKFAQLIERLHVLYPNLDCKIIQGPKDPDISIYFTKEMTHIQYIKGGMEEVGHIMSGALFHIGNDAGITHVAGSFNLPTVGIYGPTGPGSWGSFAEHNELIWGKKGVCDIRCNYDVIINCEHHICLNSITVNRVIEALFKVLQKAYPNETYVLKVNPQTENTFNKKDCIIKLNDSELLLEYHSPLMKSKIEALLTDDIEPNEEDEDLCQVIQVLNQHNIIFKVPDFRL
ncbi:glycosyltransferase family 9 protein [Psychroserpens mesophilus]|uniref:glycosyltransferase family 9 protein n=1 Tax=Psychroserpens mesophilus TaxID=325473 RepID=UPI003D646CE7